MAAQSKIADRIRAMAREHDRKVAGEAILKAITGLLFSAITFGVVFWFGWFAGWITVRQLGISPMTFAMWFTLVFFLVALGSAWYRVDPLSNLRRLTDQEYFLTLASQALGGMGYFSPRHATAGIATILIGGPAAMLESLGIWTYRIGAKSACIEEAAKVLGDLEEPRPIETIRNRSAAIVLRRLALVKFVPLGHSMAMTLTEKGSKAVAAKRVKS